jgi:hypothetical protein
MTDNTKNDNAIDNYGLVMRVGNIAPQAATATLVSNAATVTKYAVQVTTEALTTAAGATQACTLTLTGVNTTDLAFTQLVGGTNTRLHLALYAVCTANTITVTIANIGPTNAINGTVIFNVWVVKA